MGAQAVRVEVRNGSTLSVELPSSYAPAADNAADRTIRLGEYSVDSIFDANTTPAPAEALSLEIELDNTGSHDLDLTDAPIQGAESGGAPASGEDLTGKKLWFYEFQTEDNVAAILVKPGSSNGYTLFGSSITDGVKLEATDKLQRICQSSDGAAVSSTVKIINFSGTAGDTINVKMSFE